MNIKLLGPMTFDKGELPAGTILDLPERSANAAVAEGLAVVVEDEGEGLKGNDAEVIKQAAAADGHELTAEEMAEALAQLRSAIDAKFKKPELADAAKALGVEFKYDATKDEIVDAVIAAGQGDNILKA